MFRWVISAFLSAGLLLVLELPACAQKPAPATKSGAANSPASKVSDIDVDAAAMGSYPNSSSDRLIELANQVRQNEGKSPLSLSESSALAQSLKGAGRVPLSNRMPGTVGTVQIRKPFRLFAREQLIHNLSFRDTPVKEVIEEIARRGNLNLLIDKSVSGKITGDLRDVTLNEAMDSVLAAAGLQSRTLDNNTVVIATTQAMVQLGLNRPIARVFKLSYASPYDVAMIIYASVFNKGALPDFQKQTEYKTKSESSSTASSKRRRDASGMQAEGAVTEQGDSSNSDSEASGEESSNRQFSKLDQQRTVRGQTRTAVQEGVGFNNAATDPGSQQVRAFQEISADYVVEQNGGGSIIIPDSKNRQVIVVGTADDVAAAEEAIHLLDRRPKEVHVQVSLVELNNSAIRQLGVALSIQGQGASGTILGNQTALTNTTIQPGLAQGQIGPSVPVANLPSAAGVNAQSFSQTVLNLLTLNTKAGGRANIATLPDALTTQLNLLLQTNKAKLVANPSVVVVDNTETLITIATEVIHKVTSTVSLGVVTANVELTKAGIFLNVLPRVTEDGFVTMRLRPQVSAPTGPPTTFPGNVTVTLLEVRDVITQEVRVKDGQTLVLGGLFTEQEQATIAKIPYASELPVLGAFFRNTIKGRNRSELMLLITPKIVEEEPMSLTETAKPATM
jgi:type II secretory pathway component GspD/PulD (secretin)